MLKKYHYVTLGPQVSTALGNTGMSVKAFTLSHSTPYESTAFLINSSENYLCISAIPAPIRLNIALT